MDKQKSQRDLGRRERQIMDIIFQLGEASVADVRRRLPDPPSYSAVRTMIRHLESKGLLRHRSEGTKYVYKSTQSKESVSRSALQHLIKTFFDNSRADTVAAILDDSDGKLSEEDLNRIEQFIEEARKEGR